MSGDTRLSGETPILARGTIVVELSDRIMAGDEAIVSVIAREMHEINGLREVFGVRGLRGSNPITAAEFTSKVKPGHG